MTPIPEFNDPRLVAMYETVNAYTEDAQPAFYSQLAAEVGAVAIVDLGCGTGLITRDLARQGYEMTGVDPAPAMLDVARLRPYGDRVRWIDGGATALAAAGPADLAIMSGHVAQFFLTDDEWRAALRALHTAIRSGGRLVFESRNPQAREWETWTGDRRDSAVDPRVGPIEFWTEVVEIRDEIVSCMNHYVIGATGEALASPVRLRFRTEAELRQSLADAGFTVERVYGDWDRRPSGPTTRELIVVAVRD